MQSILDFTNRDLSPAPASKGSSAKFTYRLESRRIKEPDFPYPATQITGTAALTQFARGLEDLDIEKFVTLYLDAQNSLIGICITPGTINSAAVHPREIVKHALLSAACGVILVHNHPSGSLKPSDADVKITAQIKECCKLFDINVHDHLVMAGGKTLSFREEGWM